MRRPRHQVVEAQRHPEGEVVEGRQGHVGWREGPQVLRLLHLLVRGAVGRWEPRGQRGCVHAPASTDEGNGGRHVVRGPSQPARDVARAEVPLREVGQGQAPLLQLLAHHLHGPQGAREQLVLGQQAQELPHLVVVGGVQDEEGEDLRLRHAVLLYGGGEEGRALLDEDAGGLGLQGAQRAQPDGAPVGEGLHQPGHVHLALQGQEGRWRGARQEGRQHLVLRVQVRPTRGHFPARACHAQGRRLASAGAWRGRRGPAAVQEQSGRGRLVVEVLKRVVLGETRDGTPLQGRHGRRARDGSQGAPRARPRGQRGTPRRQEHQGQHQAGSAARQSLSAHCPPPNPTAAKAPGRSVPSGAGNSRVPPCPSA
ncbi:hypothetical protein EJ065_6720 [Corallococcus coralloides]|uniref:Uncharacterized protein n=1 Tax=Corallococcus coralloides TaxID=184914 RepID=A0A410S1Z1_CORCK|nr:hypothetical protein EJ065_6720 [Corallococcus coralloides]